jgi:uncharacterized protein YegL
MRRLPVYFLLDCSESMIGEAIEAVQEGVKKLLNELKSNPNALETACVSFITYSSSARQIVPLTDLLAVQPPTLTVQPGTSMGSAFKLLKDCIAREVKKTTTERKGDFRPIVFLLTDGQPTDDSTSLIQSIRSLVTPKIANIYSIGCGDDVDFEVLQQFSDAVFKLEDMKPENLGKLFIWLSASVQNASAGVNEGNPTDGIDLKKKPNEVEVVEKGTNLRKDKTPRQLFLKVNCIKKHGPFLVRHKLQTKTGTYEAIKTYKLNESEDQSSGGDLSKVSSDKISSTQPCPYCSNETWAFCPCGSFMCCKASTGEVSLTCPKCNKTNKFGFGGGNFDITQSKG